MANSNMFFPIPVFGVKKCGKSGGIVTRKDSCNKICVSGNCFVFASDTCLMFALASSGVVMYCTGKISVVVPMMMMIIDEALVLHQAQPPKIPSLHRIQDSAAARSSSFSPRFAALSGGHSLATGPLKKKQLRIRLSSAPDRLKELKCANAK
jgi:hypothetical protein